MYLGAAGPRRRFLALNPGGGDEVLVMFSRLLPEVHASRSRIFKDICVKSDTALPLLAYRSGNIVTCLCCSELCPHLPIKALMMKDGRDRSYWW